VPIELLEYDQMLDDFRQLNHNRLGTRRTNISSTLQMRKSLVEWQTLPYRFELLPQSQILAHAGIVSLFPLRDLSL
jgi:hypothetical protein